MVGKAVDLRQQKLLLEVPGHERQGQEVAPLSKNHPGHTNFRSQNLGYVYNPRWRRRMSRQYKLRSQAQLSAFPETEERGATAPTYDEAPLHCDSPENAFGRLQGIDWSFTHDDTRFLGHDLHPYPAKFIPQLPGTFISLLSSRGDLVFDPFGGSGTTALEAIRLGRRAISLDANPVATLIGRVKTARTNGEATRELHSLHGALRTLLESTPVKPSELVNKYATSAPEIANREKWFSDEAYGELAHIKFRLSRMKSETARDIALLALSRTVLSASFQDSETRYKSVPRQVKVGETTRRYVKEFETVMRSVARNGAATRYGISRFLTGDARYLATTDIPDSSVDFVVTSPPYGNATDYHLYHRFRLLWLGHDPIALSKVEIGSHLKHQREATSFESYFNDMLLSLSTIHRVLKDARYAALVIGDSVYKGKTFETARLLEKEASKLGFDASTCIDRNVHRTKRSFTPAGRRAATESLLVLRKAARDVSVIFEEPPYKLWSYESVLRNREIAALGVKAPAQRRVAPHSELDVAGLQRAKTLVFTHQLRTANERAEDTWQAILENGMAASQSSRKDPKYVTHGIHPYKGKFYPQLAKGLINQLGLAHGARVLDPFCGSGTTLLEGHLNGYETFGCDLHPLAAQIARAKTSILDIEPDVLTEVVSSVIEAIDNAPEKFPAELSQFNPDCREEINRWFAPPAARKLNGLLNIVRVGGEGAVRDFLEVVVSSIIRDISQQDPSDLRIRYRKKLIADANVLGLFKDQLQLQFSRVEKFWKVRGYAPNPFFKSHVVAGDNRVRSTYEALGLSDESVDLVLTSPPYAMALPYIDTDRLSLLTIYGISGAQRRPLEQSLIGSRELTATVKNGLQAEFLNGTALPDQCQEFLNKLHRRIDESKDAGFRKQNMPALIYRFLRDMRAVFLELYRLARHGAEAMIVIGDSKMSIDDTNVRIPTTDMVEAIAIECGFTAVERIDISVTTEKLLHIKNAITENVVLRLRKP